MTSPEQADAPSLYDELFVGFGNIAAQGTIDYGPLDGSFAAGNDGTRTPEGDVASGFDYTITGDALPQAIREKGIDEVGVWKYACAIVGDEIWPERVWVNIHESIGLSKVITFSKERGEITATLSVDPDSDSEDTVSPPPWTTAVIEGLMRGETHWLDLEGPEGDFARLMHVGLTAPNEPGPDEFELLSFILQELNRY